MWRASSLHYLVITSSCYYVIIFFFICWYHVHNLFPYVSHSFLIIIFTMFIIFPSSLSFTTFIKCSYHPIIPIIIVKGTYFLDSFDLTSILPPMGLIPDEDITTWIKIIYQVSSYHFFRIDHRLLTIIIFEQN